MACQYCQHNEYKITEIFNLLFPITPWPCNGHTEAIQMIIEKIKRDYDTTRIIEKGIDIK